MSLGNLGYGQKAGRLADAAEPIFRVLAAEWRHAPQDADSYGPSALPVIQQ